MVKPRGGVAVGSAHVSAGVGDAWSLAAADNVVPGAALGSEHRPRRRRAWPGGSAARGRAAAAGKAWP
eukprot:2652638-Pyramimonas_sp.AAC.1